MGTEVRTHSTCDKCGKKTERAGAEGDTPEIGWAVCTLTFRLDGAGWTNNDNYEVTLCPDCAHQVVLFLGISES